VGVLEHEPDLAAHGLAVSLRIQPVDPYRAARRQLQAVQKPGECALATAIAANNADASLRQLQVDVAQHHPLAKGMADVVEYNHETPKLRAARPKMIIYCSFVNN